MLLQMLICVTAVIVAIVAVITVVVVILSAVIARCCCSCDIGIVVCVVADVDVVAAVIVAVVEASKRDCHDFSIFAAIPFLESTSASVSVPLQIQFFINKRFFFFETNFQFDFLRPKL